VSAFREQRLLLHLHEQLTEQLDHNPIDWLLHFQLGNLLAFSDDYSYGHNKQSDMAQADEHYQTALTLLQQTHEQDYTMYQNKHNMLDTPVTPMDDIGFTDAGYGAILYEDEEEKFDKPMKALLTLPMTISIAAALESNDGGYSETESDDGTPSSHRMRSRRNGNKSRKMRPIRKVQPKSMSVHEFPAGGMFGGQSKAKRQRASLKEMQQEREHAQEPRIDFRKQIDNTSLFQIQNAYRSNTEEDGTKRSNKLKMWKQNKPRKKYKVRKRKLMIKIQDSNEKVAQSFCCKYTAALSEEEMAREHEKKMKLPNLAKKSSNSTKKDVTTKYVRAAAQSLMSPVPNKRPSIIQMLTDSAEAAKGGSVDRSHRHNDIPSSPISIMQSESEMTDLELDVEEYLVPEEITKAYTECFFAYGKYLTKNQRVKEGIINLLQCASWYDDSFVDPSCLTSLVLPPQFLFQDSVKKRHCINFKTLCKFISKLISDEQKKLDQQFKRLNIAKYQREYNIYLSKWEQEQTALCHVQGDSDEDLHLLPTLSNGSSGFGSNVHLRLDTANIRSNVSDASSPMNIISPFSASTPGSSVDLDEPPQPKEDKNKNLINYEVYPQEVQELVCEYLDICQYYHRLGTLLADFLRYGDAKREYNQALKICRKLKMKPPIYDEILADLRMTQRNVGASGKERAQFLAHRTPGSRSRAPQSPTFEFSFSHYSESSKKERAFEDRSPFAMVMATAK